MSNEMTPEEFLRALTTRPTPTREQALAHIEDYRRELSLMYRQRLSMMKVCEGAKGRAPFTRSEVLEWSERSESLAEFYELKRPPFVDTSEGMSSGDAGEALHLLLEWFDEQVQTLKVPEATPDAKPSPLAPGAGCEASSPEVSGNALPVRETAEATPTPAPEGVATQQPDGPGPRSCFFWKGKPATLSPKPYRVSELLWDRARKAPHDEVLENAILKAVWGDKECDHPQGGLRDSAHAINRAFDGAGFNLTVEFRNPTGRKGERVVYIDVKPE